MTSAQALRRSVIATYLSLAEQAPGVEIDCSDGAWICRSSIRHPIGNFAIGFSGTRLAERVVNEAMARPHFRIYSLPGDEPNDIETLVLRAGLRHRYELTGMTLNDPVDARASICEAASAEAAAEVAAFITDTFFWRSPKKSREALGGIMARTHPQHRFFYEKDEAGILAAGTLTLDAEVIGLYNLCVRDDARSRGVGSSFVAELSRRAKALSGYVTLLCDQELVPWYSRQGYERVGSLQAFSA